MCGILAILGDQDVLAQSALKKLEGFIDQRGPDQSSSLNFTSKKCGLQLRFKASVLHLRGKHYDQPLFDNGNILLFNGQIYKYSNYQISGPDSDTSYLFSKLKSLTTKEQICSEFSKIDGPFAFIYWCCNSSTLYYGRDIFGRRSLCQLSGREELPHIISSVAVQEGLFSEKLTWTEVDCSGIHCLDFSCNEVQKTRFLWDIDHIYPPTPKCLKPLSSCLATCRTVPFPLIEALNMSISQSQAQCNSTIIKASSKFEEELFKAVERRVMFNQDTCLECRKVKKISDLCKHSRTALAFSGGIDSTLLALMLDRAIEPTQTIDLINVAFKDGSPDRIAAGDAFREISHLCPGRNWRLVLCDVSISALKSERQDVIRHLILPCNTVIDDSLGCALWFVSRGRGRALDSHGAKLSPDVSNFDETLNEFLKFTISPLERSYIDDLVNSNYHSPASQIFLGMGVDEQLGGYRSHKFAYRDDGDEGVLREISFQMRRISSRNLGRDDRTCSHHGRDIKTPFLDFNLISYLNQLPIESKMNLRPGSELCDKQILRYVGASLGLKGTSTREKRALQFGTRIANLEDPGEKGNDICSRLI